MTHSVSHLLLLRCGGVLALISQGEGLADVCENIALKKEGVVLWLKLEAVALEGSLLGSGSNRQLHKHTRMYMIKSFEILILVKFQIEQD